MSALLKKEQLKWNKVISRARALMPTEYFQGFLINSINAEKVATASERFHSIQSIRFKEGYAMQVPWCLLVLIVTEMPRQLRIYQQVGYKPTQTGYESSEFGYESTRYETSVGAERPNGYRSHCSVHLTLTTMKLPWLTLCFFLYPTRILYDRSLQ